MLRCWFSYILPSKQLELKAFPDDQFKVVSKMEQKTSLEKEKMLVTSIFYFSHDVFKNIFVRVSLNFGNVWGKVKC